ncbi:MAG: polymer-forming cytoskeletal protein [Pseudohongiellaceae bacterium]
MFGNSNGKEADAGQAHTLISRTTEVTGDIRFSGELIVEGRVCGNIYAEDQSNAVVRVAESGRVEGEIAVPSVVINGRVTGDVRSARHIELAAKAVVDGDVYYNLIEMVMGSEVNGKLLHVSGPETETAKQADPEDRPLYSPESGAAAGETAG